METETQRNLFRATAQWYDVDDRNVSRDDIQFFLKYASEAGGKVLELACGTGRVAIRLAEAGNEVWGVDLSTEMLGEFKKKFETMDPQVASRIHITHGDMCSTDLGVQLPLIIIPFRSFQALLTEKQQTDCLANVRRHLTDDGRFIINVFRPYDNLSQSWVRDETLDWEKDDPRTGCHVRRTHTQNRIDTEKQIIYPELIYYITHPDGRQERIVEPIHLRYYYEDQMRQLLISSGLQIESAMGYYDGRPISEGPELIFVCRKGQK